MYEGGESFLQKVDPAQLSLHLPFPLPWAEPRVCAGAGGWGPCPTLPSAGPGTLDSEPLLRLHV